MEDFDKNKESPHIQYWDANNLYSLAISQRLLINNFDWIKHTSQFDGDFIKTYNEERDERYLYDVDVQYIEKLHKLHNHLLFLSERMKT